MPPEGKYTSLPLRPQRDPYRNTPYPLTRGSPTPRLSKRSAELPTYSAAYPDPNEKWAPKRRASGDGKDIKDDPIIMDISKPDKAHLEVVSPSSNSQPIPPPMQNSQTTPTAYMPQTQKPARTPLPPRVPPSRALRIQPEHKYNRPVEKHRSTRKQSSFHKDLPRYDAPTQTTYHGGSRTRGIPRVTENRKRRNSPLLVPKKVIFRPSISPPPDIPLVQVSPPPSPGSGKTKRRSKVRPSQGDAVLIGVVDNGRRPDIATLAGQEPLPSDSEEISSSPDTDSSIDSSEILVDSSTTLGTSLLSQSNSGWSASHGGLIRGRQFVGPLKARRLAGVANRGTISKDNTNGDEARTADILAIMGKKICKTPQ